MVAIDSNLSRAVLALHFRKKRRQHRSRSRRKVENVKRMMEQMLVIQYQLLILSMIWEKNGKKPTKSVGQMFNPGQYVHFCSHYDRCGSDPGRMRVETITSPGSKKSIRVDFFLGCFLFTLDYQPGPGENRHSVNTVLESLPLGNSTGIELRVLSSTWVDTNWKHQNLRVIALVVLCELSWQSHVSISHSLNPNLRSLL